jgi:hypothetical protein
MSHDDFAFEPVRGLPAELPEGESLLWQGVPRWGALAVRTYHVRKIAVYFAILALCRIGFGIGSGLSWSAIAVSSAFILSLGAVAIGVFSLLAYWNSSTTVYSITNRRVLLRHGIAVPVTMNIPFELIESADLKAYADGTGEITLRLTPAQRISYLITWPHLKPGRISRPEPSFRAVVDAQHAADILRSAVAADAGANAVRVAVASGDVAASSGPRSAVGQRGAQQRPAAA